MLLSLPILRMMREHAEDQRRAERIAQEALEQQHEIAKRVRVLEWLAYPHSDAHTREGDTR